MAEIIPPLSNRYSPICLDFKFDLCLVGDIGGSEDIFRFTLRSTIHDFILIGEGNLALTMFGNTYLLSNIMLLALYNRVQPMKIWLRIC